MSQEIKKINPASRLLAILTAAKSTGIGLPGMDARTAWCEVFDIPNPESEAALFAVQSRLLALRQLFRQTEISLRQIPSVNEELFISPIPRLARVINVNKLHQTWSTYRNVIADNDMFALKYSEDLLHQNLGLQENEIPTHELQEILEELNSLYASITGSTLPAELKESLLELIRAMVLGIQEYSIKGAVALRDALKKGVGIIAANKEAIEEIKDSSDIQTLRTLLSRIDQAQNYATDKKRRPLLEAVASIAPALLGK